MAAPVTARRFGTQIQSPGFWLRNKREYGIRVINKTGSSIAANKLVAISGYDVTTKHLKVVLADADSANLATDVYVTRTAIADGSKSSVFKGFQSPASLDTSGVTTVGDPVYLDTTAGAFTATAPSAGNAMVVLVGYSIVKSSTVGQIHWDIQPPQKLGSGQIQSGADATILQASGTITSANMTGTGAGQLGHANGVVLVAAGGAGVINQLVYCIVESLFSVAAYTGGGNLSVNIGAGGAALMVYERRVSLSGVRPPRCHQEHLHSQQPPQSRLLFSTNPAWYSCRYHCLEDWLQSHHSIGLV